MASFQAVDERFENRADVWLVHENELYNNPVTTIMNIVSILTGVIPGGTIPGFTNSR